jgi:hypothetical protein
MVVMGLVEPVFLIYQSSPQIIHMNQAIGKINFTHQLAPLLNNRLAPANLLKKMNHSKACPNRTGNGFCTRSNRPCPARLITVTFNH